MVFGAQDRCTMDKRFVSYLAGIPADFMRFETITQPVE